jgi:hypothetical protein
MARHLLLATTALVVLDLVLSSCGGPVAPLTVAAGGLTTDAVLDKLDDKATHIIGQAAAAFSLGTSKAARDAQLLIAAARQEMHDELSNNWDRLDTQKVSILRSLDSSLEEMQKAVRMGGKIEDNVYLDIGSLLQSLPFSRSVPSLRRVEGATQYYKDTGYYRLVLTGNIFDAFQGTGKIEIDGKAVDPSWLNPSPPHDIAVMIPADYLTKRFDDNKLAYVPVSIRARVSNRSSGLFFASSAEFVGEFERIQRGD